jgi:N-acetylglutamate synthase-like GNAT family acetyltransferase
MPDIRIRNHFDASDIAKIIERHRTIYQEEFGYNSDFGDYVENLLKVNIECIWIAESAGDFAGCISIVRVDDRTAQLRKFLVEPKMRGQGIGKKLIQCLIDYCKKKKYEKIFLWTVDELLAARKLYQEFGFELTESKPKRLLWGKSITEQRWDLSL